MKSFNSKIDKNETGSQTEKTENSESASRDHQTQTVEAGSVEKEPFLLKRPWVVKDSDLNTASFKKDVNISPDGLFITEEDLARSEEPPSADHKRREAEIAYLAGQALTEEETKKALLYYDSLIKFKKKDEVSRPAYYSSFYALGKKRNDKFYSPVLKDYFKRDKYGIIIGLDDEILKKNREELKKASYSCDSMCFIADNYIEPSWIKEDELDIFLSLALLFAIVFGLFATL